MPIISPHILGSILLALVITIWVTSTFVTKAIFATLDYPKPFLTTYCNMCTFTLNLLIDYITTVTRQKLKKTKRNTTQEEQETDGARKRKIKDIDNEGGNRIPELEQHTQELEEVETKYWQPEDDKNPEKETHTVVIGALEHIVDTIDDRSSIKESLPSFRKVIVYASIFSILYFMACYTNNLSIDYTSPSSNMILNTTSGFFTLFVGAFCKIEKISLVKLLAVTISFVGVICITLHDLNAPSRRALIGDGLALLSAGLYGCYTVYLKQHLKSDSHDLVIVFFGYVGFATMIIMMPLIPVLHFTKFEVFELPENYNVYPMLIGNALVGTVLSQYLWARAMLLTTPLICTLGLSLTIPLTIIGEVILGTARFSWNFILGALAIVFGFALANAGYTWKSLEETVDNWVLKFFRTRFGCCVRRRKEVSP